MTNPCHGAAAVRVDLTLQEMCHGAAVVKEMIQHYNKVVWNRAALALDRKSWFNLQDIKIIHYLEKDDIYIKIIN